jgi:hypothetical protein
MALIVGTATSSAAEPVRIVSWNSKVAEAQKLAQWISEALGWPDYNAAVTN